MVFPTATLGARFGPRRLAITTSYHVSPSPSRLAAPSPSRPKWPSAPFPTFPIHHQATEQMSIVACKSKAVGESDAAEFAEVGPDPATRSETS